MDVSKIIELVNALEHTWLGMSALGLLSIIPAMCWCCLIYFVYKLLEGIFKWSLFSSIERYFDFTIQHEFSDVIEKEKSLPWYKRLELWLLRH